MAEPGLLSRVMAGVGDAADKAWRVLPPEARRSYSSLAELMGELSPGAAIRDTLDASGRMVNSALSGNGKRSGRKP